MFTIQSGEHTVRGHTTYTNKLDEGLYWDSTDSLQTRISTDCDVDGTVSDTGKYWVSPASST